MATFLTHAGVGFIAFVAGYLWCLRTWNQWEPRRHPMPEQKP